MNFGLQSLVFKVWPLNLSWISKTEGHQKRILPKTYLVSTSNSICLSKVCGPILKHCLDTHRCTQNQRPPWIFEQYCYCPCKIGVVFSTSNYPMIELYVQVNLQRLVCSELYPGSMLWVSILKLFAILHRSNQQTYKNPIDLLDWKYWVFAKRNETAFDGKF